jgi:2-keto-4-pentenoate hydratase/2-oxohepta-3-ene-1,7-dioic acid hydratase in catechol pathway
MKYVHFQQAQSKYWGSISSDGKSVTGLVGVPDDSPEYVNKFIADFHAATHPVEPVGKWSIDQVELLAPVPAPRKIICIGRNYIEHAEEMGANVEEIPVVFNKFPTCINNPGGIVVLPEISNALDYEAELVVVIGRPARNVAEKQASQYIFGYCCGNDVTARDWQKGKPGGQWLLGKSFDTFAPIGPFIATSDEVDHANLNIQLRLNGQVMQSSNTRHLIFSIEFLIAHLSRFCTLNPGDLIFTGTPSGVGAGRTPPHFLEKGDKLEVEIQGLGCLANRIG